MINDGFLDVVVVGAVKSPASVAAVKLQPWVPEHIGDELQHDGADAYAYSNVFSFAPMQT